MSETVGFFEKLYKFLEKLRKQGVDTSEMDQVLDNLSDISASKCTLARDGVCFAPAGEDADCYDNDKECILKQAGLYFCRDNWELVNEERCKDCNLDMDCCCESVLNGWAPFHCGICPMEKHETKHGQLCLPADLSPEEVTETLADCEENPGVYFRC